MREDRLNSDIIYNGTNSPELTSTTDVSNLAHLHSGSAVRRKSQSDNRETVKSVSIGKVRLSILEKLLVFLCGVAVFVGLFFILQGRIKTSNVSYQIDLTNKQIQSISQENQDLNSEVQTLSNDSRLAKLAEIYGFQIDESRIKNILK